MDPDLRAPMSLRKRVVMIAHDNRKGDLLDWAACNVGTLSRHDLSATGTTGRLLADGLGLTVTRFLSGPLGGAPVIEARRRVLDDELDDARVAAAAAVWD